MIRRLGPVPVVVTSYRAGGVGSSFTVTYAQFSPAGFFPAAALLTSWRSTPTTAMCRQVRLQHRAKWDRPVGRRDGSPSQSGSSLRDRCSRGGIALANTVSLTIGGQPAVVSFAGVVGAGLVQINAQIPTGIGSGDQAIVATVGRSEFACRQARTSASERLVRRDIATAGAFAGEQGRYRQRYFHSRTGDANLRGDGRRHLQEQRRRRNLATESVYAGLEECDSVDCGRCDAFG